MTECGWCKDGWPTFRYEKRMWHSLPEPASQVLCQEKSFAMTAAPRLMVLGNARHGKDSVCAILRDKFGLTFESSSHFVAEKAVRPWLSAKGITYSSFDEMYADRVNHRKDWHDAIADYNKTDPARLGKELYAVYDIYCGIRSELELTALKQQGVVEFTFWVDALRRLPPENSDSIKLGPQHADYIIDNNGPESDLPILVEMAYRVAMKQIDAAREVQSFHAS